MNVNEEEEKMPVQRDSMFHIQPNLENQFIIPQVEPIFHNPFADNLIPFAQPDINMNDIFGAARADSMSG